MFNGWKQPILNQEDLEQIFGLDHRLIALYMQLIHKASNRKLSVSLDSKKFVWVERGEVLFSARQYAQHLVWPKSTVSDTLKKLLSFQIELPTILYNPLKQSVEIPANTQNPVQQFARLVGQRSDKGLTILKLFYYDNLVDLRTVDRTVDRTMAGQWPDSGRTVAYISPVADEAFSEPKSVKSVKSVKSINTSPVPQEVEIVSEEVGYTYKDFIKDFNQITGKSFRGDKTSQGMFNARSKEKVTAEEFRLVIANALELLKAPRWDGATLLPYLTPEYALRPSNVQKYLNIPGKTLTDRKKRDEEREKYNEKRQLELAEQRRKDEELKEHSEKMKTDPNYQMEIKQLHARVWAEVRLIGMYPKGSPEWNAEVEKLMEYRLKQTG